MRPPSPSSPGRPPAVRCEPLLPPQLAPPCCTELAPPLPCLALVPPCACPPPAATRPWRPLLAWHATCRPTPWPTPWTCCRQRPRCCARWPASSRCSRCGRAGTPLLLLDFQLRLLVGRRAWQLLSYREVKLHQKPPTRTLAQDTPEASLVGDNKGADSSGDSHHGLLPPAFQQHLLQPSAALPAARSARAAARPGSRCVGLLPGAAAVDCMAQNPPSPTVYHQSIWPASPCAPSFLNSASPAVLGCRAAQRQPAAAAANHPLAFSGFPAPGMTAAMPPPFLMGPAGAMLPAGDTPALVAHQPGWLPCSRSVLPARPAASQLLCLPRPPGP